MRLPVPSEAIESMFESFIRRKSAAELGNGGDTAFESTSVSLSTSVPRPVERRGDERVSATLRLGKVTGAGGEQLVRLKNLSAGGLMAYVGHPPQVGDQVEIELSSQKIPSSVVWIREDLVGFKFEQDIDLGELLAGRKQRHGFRARPPRLDIRCKASVKIGKVYYTVDVHDVSLGGMKVEPIEEYCVGAPVVVVVESLK